MGEGTLLIRDIPNTFAPHVGNKMLHEADILMGLQHGVFKYEKLPDSVKERFDAYLAKIEKTRDK